MNRDFYSIDNEFFSEDDVLKLDDEYRQYRRSCGYSDVDYESDFEEYDGEEI